MGRADVQLVDRIEKRRFVGREFLLWLWFESELLEATLATQEHGPFGLWIEKRLVLSLGKASTKITSSLPGMGREAKEALLAGQLPESAGVRIAWGEEETSFVFKAEQMAVSGLKLRTVLGKEEDATNTLVEDLKPKPRSRGKSRRGDEESDEAHEAFYERMRLTQEFEGLLEALYRDFLALRLSDVWGSGVQPMLQAWAEGGSVDAERYASLKSPRKKAKAR
jgi:hypothetical protein